MIDDTQIKIDIARIQIKIDSMEKTINTFVTQFEFTPIKLIVYGLAAMIGTGVIGAILAKVVLK